MTNEEIEGFFQDLTDRYFSGEIDNLDEVHVYPFSVYVEGEYRVERTPEDSARTLRSRRRDFAAHAASGARVKLLEVEQRADGRFKAHLRLYLSGADGRTIGIGTSCFLCRLGPPLGIRLEGCEIVKRAVPARTGTTVLLH